MMAMRSCAVFQMGAISFQKRYFVGGGAVLAVCVYRQLGSRRRKGCTVVARSRAVLVGDTGVGMMAPRCCRRRRRGVLHAGATRFVALHARQRSVQSRFCGSGGWAETEPSRVCGGDLLRASSVVSAHVCLHEEKMARRKEKREVESVKEVAHCHVRSTVR